MREFLHVDDLADACRFLMDNYEGEDHINVGTGEDLTISALAELVCDIVFPGAELKFDRSKPDGMPGKVLDVSILNWSGWSSKISLRGGIESTYRWILSQDPGAIRGWQPAEIL